MRAHFLPKHDIIVRKQTNLMCIVYKSETLKGEFGVLPSQSPHLQNIGHCILSSSDAGKRLQEQMQRSSESPVVDPLAKLHRCNTSESLVCLDLLFWKPPWHAYPSRKCFDAPATKTSLFPHVTFKKSSSAASSFNPGTFVPTFSAEPSGFGEIHQSTTPPQRLQSHFQRRIATAGLVHLPLTLGNQTWTCSGAVDGQ